ncbi:MAG: hypothetical protein ACOX2V_09290 [Clostridia bacterium]
MNSVLFTVAGESGRRSYLRKLWVKHKAIYYVANEMGLDYNFKQISGVVAKYFDEHFTFESLEALFKYLVQKSKTQKDSNNNR